MTRSSPGRVLAASFVAAALAAAVDTVLTLGSNPDPASASLRLGLAVSPLLVETAWACPAGLIAGWLSGGGRAAPATVVSLWALGILLDAWRAGQSVLALAIIALVVALGGLALGRLAIDATAAMARLPAARRHLLWTAAGLALFASASSVTRSGLHIFGGGTGPCASGAAPAGPNILLVSVDALRADTARRMRSYQRLAAAGIEYTEHFTSSPWTLPSIASLMTGLPPDLHGAGLSLSAHALLAKTPVPVGLPSLARTLGTNGYRTHAIVTNPFLTSRYGVDEGFCSFENVTMGGELVRGLAHTTPMRLARILAPRALPSDRASTVRAHAERWLATAGDRPFFLWLHFLDPHAPYGDRDGDSTSLTLDLMAFQQEPGLMVPFHGVGLLRAGEYRPGPDERRRIAGLYQQDVDFADQQIGRLLDFLAERDLARRTAVVFTADHGEEFWEHGGVEHGRTLYDEVLHIPLLVVPAGEPRGPASRGEPTNVVDVAPTILALAGIEEPGWRGVDLLTGLAGSERAFNLGNLLFGEEWTGVRTAHLKYMRSEHGEERLFDLIADPGEQVNQVGSMHEALAAVRALVRPMPAVRADLALAPAAATGAKQ